MCADLALLGGRNVCVMKRQLKLERTVGILRVPISFGQSKKRLDILTKDRYMVKPDHLVFQV
jgi:hypothetical protein